MFSQELLIPRFTRVGQDGPLGFFRRRRACSRERRDLYCARRCFQHCSQLPRFGFVGFINHVSFASVSIFLFVRLSLPFSSLVTNRYMLESDNFIFKPSGERNNQPWDRGRTFQTSLFATPFHLSNNSTPETSKSKVNSSVKPESRNVAYIVLQPTHYDFPFLV